MPVNQVYKATGEKIIDISDSTVTAANMAQGVTAYDASGTKITGSMQGGFDMSVKFTAGNKVIPEHLFFDDRFGGARQIEEVVIGDDITGIDDTAFYKCSTLTSVTIGDSVTSIGYKAFFNCSGLTSVNIPNSVISIDSTAFNICTNLRTITINKPQDSVSGAPWGATNATVVWTG